ncbi:hypothetical protein QQ045_007197 [Rhodiola kirilowii]
MDRVRVYLRILHFNATSHKWVLGAFAELLDNALDEAVSSIHDNLDVHDFNHHSPYILFFDSRNGATYVNTDTITNKKDENPMLLIEDVLTTPEQSIAIMDMIESRWDELVGEMPLKVCYPAIESHGGS